MQVLGSQVTANLLDESRLGRSTSPEFEIFLLRITRFQVRNVDFSKSIFSNNLSEDNPSQSRKQALI